jgi:uncharacterized protein (TIGR02453 family)
MTTFTGFPRQAVQFLLDLRHNNEREWFKAHKADFDAYVTAPVKAFAAALAPRLEEALGGAGIEGAVQHAIFRIYRDTRFSKDKTPYKTNLGMWFWQGERPRMENSGFYFHLEPPMLMLAAGVHTFPKPLLEAYRDAVVDPQLGASLVAAIQAIESTGEYDIGQKGYKRVPRGFDKDHPRADLLLYKGMTVAREDLIPEALYSAGLIDYCLEEYSQMFPLHRWLNALISQEGGDQAGG